MFEPLPRQFSFPEAELRVLEFWEKNRVFARSLEQRAGAPRFVFYEGPPTANGMPHPGHCLTRAMKDLFPRYQTMCGKLVERKAGWDTHGLPVEVEVCKELGIHTKEEIEAYGVEKFVQKCIESVFRYTRQWEHMTRRLGFWVNLEEAYVTYHQSYVESVWWSLKTLFERGLLYQGHKVVWWWAQGGTALSAGEVGEGYREVDDPSVYVKFPLVDDERARAHLGSIGVPPVRTSAPPDPHRGVLNAPVTGSLSQRRRILPHWEAGGSTYFLTFRLLEGELSTEERTLILNACRHWDSQRIMLHAVVVMPDHVHMLCTPLEKDKGEWWSIADLMHSIKGYTAKQINEKRGAEGLVWQREYYDRIIRSESDFEEKWNYIVSNPSRRGLPDTYEWVWVEASHAEDDSHRRDADAPQPSGPESPNAYPGDQTQTSGNTGVPPVRQMDRVSLLVWTTTPWTLISNQFAAVHPDLEYALVEDPGPEGGEAEYLYIAKDLVDVIGKRVKRELRVVGTCKGVDLVGLRYLPPFDNYYARDTLNQSRSDLATATYWAKEPRLGEATAPTKDSGRAHVGWRVLSADFVTIESGTGLVHEAPAFGEVDFDLLQKERAQFEDVNAVPLLCAVGPNGNFDSDAPPQYRGRWVKDCDKDILRELRDERKTPWGTPLLYHQETCRHDYPFCPRSPDDPLIQYARRSWFVRTSQFKDEFLKNNAAIHWLPEHIKEGRFGDFLRNNVDWALSRERYWGTPLPIWACERCGKMEAIGSFAELQAKPGATDVVDEFEGGGFDPTRPGMFKLLRSYPDGYWATKSREAAGAGHPLPQHLRVHKPYIDAWTYACSACRQQHNQHMSGSAGVPPAATEGNKRSGSGTLPSPITAALSKRKRYKLPHWEAGGSTYVLTFRVREGELTPDERTLVLEACQHWDGARLLLYAAVVMPDHVHMLCTPLENAPGQWWSIADLTHSIKGFTAQQINKRRGASGSVWQAEYYDRIIRDERDFDEKWNYVVANPQRRGFPEDYAWVWVEPTHAPAGTDGGPEARTPQVVAGAVGGPEAAARMRRAPEVIDCWWDAGSMPFAQWGFPHAPGSIERFAARFPADFISEAIDQTRGWFYGLLSINTLLFAAGANRGGPQGGSRPPGGSNPQGGSSSQGGSSPQDAGRAPPEGSAEYPLPYRACIVLGLILGEDGLKMSKRTKNYKEPDYIFDHEGADAMRWYFYSAQTPWTSVRFQEAAIRDAQREFLVRLYNVLSFFNIYANIDGFEVASDAATERRSDEGNGPRGTRWRPVPQRSEIDRWIVSELRLTTRAVRESMDRFENYPAAQRLIAFVDALSNWYVRRCRDRFWRSVEKAESSSANAEFRMHDAEKQPEAQRRQGRRDSDRAERRAPSQEALHKDDASAFRIHHSAFSPSDQDKWDAYNTLYECLLAVSKLIAPFTPFFAETMYQNLAGTQGHGDIGTEGHADIGTQGHADTGPEDASSGSLRPSVPPSLRPSPLSVHLCDYPAPDAALIDARLAAEMELVREIASLGRAARTEAKIKVRQPLERVEIILALHEHEPWLSSHAPLIAEELNVKQVEFTTEADHYVQYEVKPNFKAIGPKHGKLAPRIAAALKQLADPAAARKQLLGDGRLALTVDGQPVELSADEVEIRLQARPGWSAAPGKVGVVVLSTEISDALREEGLVRELIHHVQTLRKERNLAYEARITLYVEAPAALAALLRRHEPLVRSECLAERIEHGLRAGLQATEAAIEEYAARLAIETN